MIPLCNISVEISKKVANGSNLKGKIWFEFNPYWKSPLLQNLLNLAFAKKAFLFTVYVLLYFFNLKFFLLDLFKVF